jgi:hypothetical protein
MQSLPIRLSARRIGAPLVLLLLLSTQGAQSQQQVPPTPAAPTPPRQQMPPPPSAPAGLAAAKATVAPHVADLANRRATIFKGLALSEVQQTKLLGNLGEVGCQPMKVMQANIPVPPALVSGEACQTNYAGTPEQLSALRRAVEQQVRQHKATDVPAFTSNIPKDCSYKELYYYLAVLGALPRNP